MVRPSDADFNLEDSVILMTTIFERLLEQVRRESGIGPLAEERILLALQRSKLSEVDPQSLLN